jgi:prepilin peptidase CpaA
MADYLLILLLSLCAASDIRNNKIPNILIMPFALSAITLHSINSGLDGFIFSVGGMASGIGLLLFFYLVGGMGAGDVKLMGAVGSFLGTKATIEAFVLIAIAGGVYSLAIIFIRQEIFRGFFSEKLMVFCSMIMLRQYEPIQTDSLGQKPRLKYGVAIAFGTITYLLLRSLGIKFFA